MKYTEKDFYAVQERFSKWRNETYKSLNSCLRQNYDLENGFMYEGWNSFDEKKNCWIFYIVEFRASTQEFYIYDLRTELIDNK